MTTLIGWIAVDPRGPSAIYLASDSRISWGSGREWDVGRKLFACSKHPDIFGYYGEVLFPSLLLGQMVEAIDLGCLLSAGTDGALRHAAFVTYVKSSYETRHRAPKYDFGIVHAARSREGMSSTFQIWHLSYSAKENLWSDVESIVPRDQSLLILALGSGSGAVESHMKWVKEKSQGETSRAIFWALCDSIRSSHDKLSGGAPQLVGIYRKSPAKAFGVIYEGKRYLNGLLLDESLENESLEWRDEYFQRVDSATMLLKPEAQRHHRLVSKSET